MSKASEWAARSDAIQEKIDVLEEERGEIKFTVTTEPEDGKRGSVSAFVMDGPFLHIGAYDATLAPNQALAFARWILDTFGEDG